MNLPITPPEIERFRAVLMNRLGLQFDDSKLGRLAEVLHRRLVERRAQGGDYLASLERAPPPGECDALAEELTVTETYFFRNHEQFDALAAVALPDRLRRNQERRRLSLLSAGCASGEEAYSLAIAAKRALPDSGWRAEIHAADLNPLALAKARRGRYGHWAFRETPPEIKARWFSADGSLMAVKETIRRLVRFESANLADPGAPLWQGGGYDVIFCRNMLMYFSGEQRRATIERLTQALLPGGYLFLGHAESLTGLSDAFHLHHTHGSFYYQRKEAADAGIPRPPVVAPPPDPSQPPDLAAALDLPRHERFAETLASIGGQPRTEEDPDALLSSAVLLQESGKREEAEQACARLLGLDELSAGAHYVLALCRENAGDLTAAAEHDRIALYLDPAFAMPRLHLGLLARRSGERETARRELSQALLLLAGEGAARLLMYGSGFNREALTSLCRAALQESGGRP